MVIDANSQQNLQCLYGTSAVFLNEKNEVTRKGGEKYTKKDGIVNDAKKLLEDVKKIVDTEKATTGWKLTQTGVK